MNRREFLSRSTTASLGIGLAGRLLSEPTLASAAPADGETSGAVSEEVPEAVLAGTAPLTMEGDLAAQMVDGIHQFLLKRTAEAPKERAKLWKRDYSSLDAYARSISGNREDFQRIIGAVDARVEAQAPASARGVLEGSPEVGQGRGYKVYAVRWAVLRAVTADSEGLIAEGLLLQPETPPVARVVAIPDADWTPEMIVGMASGVSGAAQFGRRLAENGCQVMIPTLISRADTLSGIPGIGYTNEPEREWIYRMAFEVGRHVIGFEVQKVLAAVDWFESENESQPLPIGVMGYGEGGLLALYCGALDSRIQATGVSGYFREREGLWQEPIYRDVWGLVREFGDADLASLVAPRSLLVEACRGPQVDGPPPATEVHKACACPNGKLFTPPLDSVQREVERAREYYAALKAQDKLRLVVDDGGQGEPGSARTLSAFLQALNGSRSLRGDGAPPVDHRANYDPQPRLQRQFNNMVSYTQALIRKSPYQREEFWAKANSTWPSKPLPAIERAQEVKMLPSEALESQWANSARQWTEATKEYRDYVWEEVIGRLPSPSLPANPRTRLVYDEPKYKGYEVVLDVWPDVFAYGILLVPKGIAEGERRPVVVCQHGLEGRPADVADPNVNSRFYHNFADRLAEEGFVVYAPQNPYIGGDNFRVIQRMGHPLKLALFSFIIGQHDRTLEWLAQQPFVDPERIGLYGLSYGGKTAVRVPPFVDKYALSICSGDFNQWVWKTTNVEDHFTYLLTEEYDMYEFNLANTANYAELANLIAPRPFMVERGHYDAVSVDQKVAFEYAKVRWFYAYMGIPENTRIQYLSGPHMVYMRGTFEFLRQHLRWKPGRWGPLLG